MRNQTQFLSYAGYHPNNISARDPFPILVFHFKIALCVLRLAFVSGFLHFRKKKVPERQCRYEVELSRQRGSTVNEKVT